MGGFIKAFIYTIVVGLLVGGALAYLQKDYKYSTIIEVKDSFTKDYIEEASVKTYPELPLKFDITMSGEGRYIYGSAVTTPVYLIIEANGYEKERQFVILKPDEVHIVELDGLKENKEKEKSKLE